MQRPQLSMPIDRVSFITAACCFILLQSFLPSAVAIAAEETPTVDARVAGLESREGLLTVWVDREAGKILLELPPPAADGVVGRYLFVEGLAAGLGSNPVGLDRGQLGNTVVVVLRHLGGRLLVEQPNLAYRALTDDAAERAAVEQSFARSVLWATDYAAKDGDGRALVDLTPFLLRDNHGVARRLKGAGQGSFKLDAARSVVDTANCLAFPDNLEFEALLTYAGDEPGAHVRSVTPTPQAVTLTQHYSLVRLPDDGYTPRAFDPRAGSFAIRFLDYAAALDEPVERRWIVRHRLRKTDPAAARSPVVEPIVYHLDPGVPEPVRGALFDGARWWADAFDAAGFVDAFRVELLPDGIHPLDVRYNVIEWVHRSTRGWSYGGGITDPRTGEMIKGHVNLGSLRVRQDRLIFEGLLGVENTGTGAADDPVELALARIRQLSAHEVGHTLGFTHNFAASTWGGRASVMDYPAPLVRVDDAGALDVSEAYAVGAGAWDVHAVAWAYSEFPPGADEGVELEGLVQAGLAANRLFLADADARPAGAAHPAANLWDNGDDPVAELEQVLAVRAAALADFGARNIALGRPLARLEEVLAPIYFYHRYQLNAAGKVVGGVDYRYALRGDGQPPPRVLPVGDQRRALDALLAALAPDVLDLSDDLLEQLPPRPFGYDGNRELFEKNTSPLFDALGAAETAADLVVAELLQRDRAARLVDQRRRDAAQLGLDDVVQELVNATWIGAAEDQREAALRRAAQRAVVRGLLRLSADAHAAAEVRGIVDAALDDLHDRLSGAPAAAGAPDAHVRFMAREIARYLDRPGGDRPVELSAPAAPPGSPIGVPPLWSACSQNE